MSQAPVRPAARVPGTSPAPGLKVPVPAGASPLDFPAPIPSRTPQLLQRLQLVIALALVIAGAMSAWVITDLRSDLATAPNLAQQYARLGQVQHDLSTAARLADASVILGEAAGDPKAKSAIDQVVAASGLLVEAAKERPQDAAALQEIGGDVLRYSLVISSALGTPRAQALPQLAAAQTQLGDLLTEIQQLQAQLSAEAGSRPWSQGTPAVTLVGLAMIAVVVWVSWVVARRTHRLLNLGLVAAGIALLALIGVAAGAQGTAASASDESRSTQFTRVVNTAAATRHLDAAQQVLSTAVLTQTWSADAEAAFTKESKAAAAASKTEDLPKLSDLNNAQDALAAQLTKGQWAPAATALLSDKSGALANEADAFREAGAQVSDEAVGVAAAAPTDARTTMIAQLVLAIALALIGAALGVLGLYQRLREYR